MPTIRQYEDVTDRIQVVELWRNVFGYETAHNEPNLAISKKIAANDGLFFVAAEPRWPPKFPRVWPLQTPPLELIGNGE